MSIDIEVVQELLEEVERLYCPLAGSPLLELLKKVPALLDEVVALRDQRAKAEGALTRLREHKVYSGCDSWRKIVEGYWREKEEADAE